MRFLTVLGIVFYAAVIIIIGLALIVFSLNLLLPQDINSLLIFAQSSQNSRIVIGLSGALLILISYSFAQIILGKFQRERTIAFATSKGSTEVFIMKSTCSVDELLYTSHARSWIVWRPGAKPVYRYFILPA